MANTLNSSADPICPTFSSGYLSIQSTSNFSDLNNDSANPGSANGYQNQEPGITVGSFNNDWNNGCLTQSVTPTYSSGLLSFGNTGRQS